MQKGLQNIKILFFSCIGSSPQAILKSWEPWLKIVAVTLSIAINTDRSLRTNLAYNLLRDDAIPQSRATSSPRVDSLDVIEICQKIWTILTKWVVMDTAQQIVLKI